MNAKLPRGAVVALTIGCAVLLGGCTSSPTTTGSTSTGSNAPPASTTIAEHWRAFFSGATSPTQKIALLQDGRDFAAIIDGQASSAEAKSAGATVSKVTLESSSTARVNYTITLGGQPALRDQLGQAVLQGSVWKVGRASFCGLLSLEQVTTPACPTSAS